jgi:hypothetical protein
MRLMKPAVQEMGVGKLVRVACWFISAILAAVAVAVGRIFLA